MTHRRTSSTLALVLIVFALTLVLAPQPLLAQSPDASLSAKECPPEWGNSAMVSSGPVYNAAANTTTFRYRATARGKSISHVTVQLGACALSLITTGTTGGYEMGYDPTTGVTGIKWEDGIGEDATKTYTLVLSGQWQAEWGTGAIKGASFCAVLKPSVLTVLNCSELPTATPTNTPEPPTATPTNTSVPPTATPTNTPVPPTATPTDTPVPPTATPTSTPEDPTATPTNTPEDPTATPTNTPEDPTATPTSTPEDPTATPTNTPVPPTATPTSTPAATRTPLGILDEAAIGDTVWLDGDRDGIQDGDEPGVGGVTVRLYTGDGQLIDQQVTGATGFYLFYGLQSGSYAVEFVAPDGYALTGRNTGSDSTLDSDADPLTGWTATTFLEPHEIDSTWDAGLWQSLGNDGACLTCPDYLVFQSDRADGNLDVWRSRLDGSEPTRLTSASQIDMQPALNFAGQEIAFASQRSGDHDIWRMSIDGGGQTNVTRFAQANDLAPSWSCYWIAFQSDRDGNWEIYKTDPSGLEQIRLTDDEAADEAPAWSPNGQWIAFESDRDGNYEIYVMDSEGGNLRRMTTDDAIDRNASWSIDGQWLYFESNREGQFDIYKLNIVTNELVRLTDDPADDTDPDGTPYCELVYFETEREGQPQVYSMYTDGAHQVSVIKGETEPDFWSDHLDNLPEGSLDYLPSEPISQVVIPLVMN